MKTSATGLAASCTIKRAVWRTAPFERARFTFQVPRLSTVWPFMSEVEVAGNWYIYVVVSSVDASFACLTKPAVSIHSTFHGNRVTGTPEALAHTTSPRKKSDCGVTQSLLKVAIPSTKGWGAGRRDVNRDDREPRVAGLETEREPALLVFATVPDLAPGCE